ncbi:GGDEF domain-containing protein [Pseudoxanthomonas kalamensis]|uniref:GGDEF domain-containing protein n=1 Tax=Pseudoxanthomonas kalamensis TaxID=289483 RepID=UPI001390AEDC|nr:GGDEF domain-containing protein [Pseudoxanthomonas kalamensis]
MRMSHHDPYTTQRTICSDGPDAAPSRSACVVVIRGEGLGRHVDIDDGSVLIGRLQEADLHIPHNSVSRRHCEIWRDGDAYWVRDLGATNRTRLNDVPLQTPAALFDGDHLTLGDCVVKFLGHGSVETGYHDEIYQLATHDPLTEMYNRRHFIELTEKEIARAIRHQRALAMCIIDVDLFKPVNDRHGHIAGDSVLRQISQLVRMHVRGEDAAARIGGEEFAVLLPECDAGAAYGFAERLREAIEVTEFRLDEQPHRITVSAGIATLTAERGTCSRMMAAADQALYRAKHQGRNRVCLQPD